MLRLAAVLLVAGCAHHAAAPAARVAAVSAPPPSPPATVRRPVDAASPDAADIMLEARRLELLASDYVASSASRHDVIDRLTVLTSRMKLAVGWMEVSKQSRKYFPERVEAARRAVAELRDYLAARR